MNVYIAPVGGEIGKFRGVVESFPTIWNGTVLDVGCRSGRFRNILPHQHGPYLGIDLSTPADIVGNLEAGLPFNDRSFDTIVCLDVLEHTNDIHGSMLELCRVAREYVVISLPNVYELRGRIKFLLGKPLSGKYILPNEPVIDRHRWLFSLSDADRFCTAWGQRCGFRVISEGCLVGPKRASALGKHTISALPDLLAPTYLVLLQRVTS